MCPSSENGSSEDKEARNREAVGNNDERRVTDETKDHLRACGSWTGAMNGSIVRRVQMLAKGSKMKNE